MADAFSMSRVASTAIAPRARVRRARRLAAAATTGRPVSRRAAAAESSGEASAEAAESVAKDGGDDPDSGSPEMFDNLANIFLKRDQEDWIGLLASSERWPTLRDGFFARLKTRAAEEEDPEDMLRLSRLLRLMQGTSERVAIYQDLLAEVQDTGEEMWEGMVTSRRAEFTTEFFQFLRFKLEALVRDQASTSATRSAASREADAEAVEAARQGEGGVTNDRATSDMKTARDEESRSDANADEARDDLARLASRLLSICEAFDEATKDTETLENAAATSVNNAISFVLYNEAIFQFVQWFATEPDVDVQVLVYDSVDAYVADCQIAPQEVRPTDRPPTAEQPLTPRASHNRSLASLSSSSQVLAHICSAIDYKDNDKLLEEPVNHMAANTLRSDGVCVKLVTKPGESLPGVYVEDRDRQLLQQIPLDDAHESHFDGVCQECEP